MRIQFVKFDPNGNITILVESRVPREAHAALAARLMAEIGGEQAGYIEPSGAARARLQMMAESSAETRAWRWRRIWPKQTGLRRARRRNTRSRFRARTGLVRCRVRREGEAFRGRVQMPLPESVGEAAMPLGAAIPAGAVLPLVRLPGIAHLIVPEGMMSDREAEPARAGTVPRTRRGGAGIDGGERRFFAHAAAGLCGFDEQPRLGAGLRQRNRGDGRIPRRAARPRRIARDRAAGGTIACARAGTAARWMRSRFREACASSGGAR